jgi:hypothetical protein
MATEELEVDPSQHQELLFFVSLALPVRATQELELESVGGDPRGVTELTRK